MRNLPSESNSLGLDATSSSSGDWRARTQADFSSVLLELARAQRGFLFFAEADSRCRSLADRAHRALKSELDRAGAIEFQVDQAGFGLIGTAEVVDSSGALLGLHEVLQSHGLERIRIDRSVTRTALTGFLALLGQDAGPTPAADHFARALGARDTQGIRVNEIDNIRPPTSRKLSSTPPRALASATRAGTAATDAPMEAEHRDLGRKPTLDEAPLDVVSADDRGERLRARLIELDATAEDAPYRERILDIVFWTEDLWNDELIDESYRAMLVLADHAVGRGGRSEAQARAAAASFASLAQGDRLDDLIRRATLTRDASSSSVRAAQLLLQLGEVAVPAILDCLSEENDPDRAAPLRALILTQGDTALPHLIAAIEGPDEERARIGIRLAGELQNPSVLRTLLGTLGAPDTSRHVETIRALSLLPGELSKEALTESLTSDAEEIASAAAEALAATDGTDSIPALLDVLEASVQTGRTALGVTLLKILGELGDERAVPRLCSILERRPVLRRAHWHSVQRAAVEALATLPTKEARRSVERAALQAPRRVRERARAILERPDDGE